VWLVIAFCLAVGYRRRWLFLQVLVADLVANVSAYGLKQAFGRARPSSVFTEPRPLVPAPRDGSFPSGHAATSFACATVLALALPRYGLAFFVLAAAIAWSRVYVGVHYPLDVLGGAILGVLVATALRMLVASRRRSRPATPPG
jgi:undecaprenyl-diphosphatase